LCIFSSIRDAIFGLRAAAAPAAAQPAAAGAPAAGAQPQPQAAAPVDVGAVLAQISQSKGNPNLNYQSSIVDLMKLLDLDSSLANREQLATELGYAGAKDGSAEMNIWLHRKVMEQLAASGGHVPDSLKH
jgi:3-oxoacyl-ACP reductase-like protein